MPRGQPATVPTRSQHPQVRGEHCVYWMQFQGQGPLIPRGQCLSRRQTISKEGVQIFMLERLVSGDGLWFPGPSSG